MKAIGVVALNTFRETIRDKILYNLLFFALLLIAMSILLATLTVGEQARVIVDVGLGAIHLFGVLMAIFLGIGLLRKEIERRTLYTLLARPISRTGFLLGKALGLALTLALNTAIMVLALYGILLFNRWRWGHPLWEDLPDIGQAALLLGMEFWILTVVGLLFSTFTSSSSLSALLTFSVFLIGHGLPQVQSLIQRLESPWIEKGIRVFEWIFPNLEIFNVKAQVVHGLPISPSLLGWALLYGMVYAGWLFLLAAWIFQQRDFR